MRTIGSTEIEVSPVALGCWPIAGMTSLNVNNADSLETLRSALDCGINFFDTAYAYGPDGESERLIAQVISERRHDVVIASKGGIVWDGNGERQFDARPSSLRYQCERSLKRLATDYLDVYYLHAPDPQTPVESSAKAMKSLMDDGKVRCVGVSNLSVEQMQQFHEVCPISAVQPPYNMLQRQIESDILPWCAKNNVSAMIYWPLMKGLLAGKLPRDFKFQPGDGRAKYPMFQGEEWQRNQDFLDDLRLIANDIGKTVSQLVINWTIHQPHITAALCGAKRAYQIRESAGALGWTLSNEAQKRIDDALARRGQPQVKGAV